MQNNVLLIYLIYYVLLLPMRQEWKDKNLDSALRFPADPIIYLSGILLYFVLHYVIKTSFSGFMIKRFSRVSPSAIDKRKFTRALWKAFCYSILGSLGVLSLLGEDWIYAPIGITLEWPNNQTPSKINLYYMVEMVYYSGSFLTMFFEEKQSDFYLMIWHHVVTLILVGSSYHMNFLRYGAFIMTLHDISDPWMESAKIAVYLGYQTLGNALFVIFTFMFIVPRIFIYMYMILLPGYGFLLEYGSKVLVPIWILLICVFLLNLYWAVLIVRMLIAFLKKGRVEKDIRDIKQEPSQQEAGQKKPDHAEAQSKDKNRAKHKKNK